MGMERSKGEGGVARRGHKKGGSDQTGREVRKTWQNGQLIEQKRINATRTSEKSREGGRCTVTVYTARTHIHVRTEWYTRISKLARFRNSVFHNHNRNPKTFLLVKKKGRR